MAKRTDDERLAHFARRYDEIAKEPAAHFTWNWSVHFEADTATTSFQEPSRQEIRSLLVDVRKLDAPREDLYLPGVIELLLGRAIEPVFREGLAKAKSHYDEHQGPGGIQFQDDQGVMTLREAFEIWVYGEHLHDDFDKEQRWKNAWIAQGMIRSNAVTYMGMLLGVAGYCRRVIELDPGLASIVTPTRAQAQTAPEPLPGDREATGSAG